MHICLPDTREVRPAHGSAFLLYNVHIDGLYHCSLRFKQLLHLHQTLSKKFTSPYHQLPPFPPKKLLPLSAAQIEERRTQLEKYLQNISQDKAICNSSIFNLFLLEAQRESTRICEDQVHLDIELVNGQKIRVQIVTHDSADAVLTAVCRALGLDDRYHAYFCLCLCGYDVIRDKLIIKRRLSFFESPYVTLQMAIQQQEQLQNVLSVGYPNVPATTTSGNTNNCRCQSCSTQQLQQSSNQSSTTGVPLVGSSSVSFVNNRYHDQQQQSPYNQNNNFQSQQYHVSQACYHQNGNRQVLNTSSSSSTPVSNHDQASSSTATTFVTHRILLRKSYWDPLYDTYILNDQQALNLLFIQTVYDIKHSLMFVNRETYHQLETLLASDSKLEYILLARTLKYYNYVHFEPCLSDYPRPRTKVMISIGSKELNMRVLKSPKTLVSPSSSSSSSTTTTTAIASSPSNQTNRQQVGLPSEQVLYCTSSLVPSGYQHLITKDDLIEEEYNFKVPLIRCWRLTSLETLNSNPAGQSTQPSSIGKRRSFSLFNSIVGNSNGSNNGSTSQDHHHRQNEFSQNSINSNSGIGCNSLITAIAGVHANSFNRQQQAANYYKQHETKKCGEPATNHHLEDHTQFSQYELSFEYLISKDTLKWITICSDQAIFISISLQGVVDELVSKRDGIISPFKGPEAGTPMSQILPASQGNRQQQQQQQQKQLQQQQQDQFTYVYRDGTQKSMNTSNQKLIDKFGTTLGYSPMNQYALAQARQRQQVRASALFSSSARFSGTNNLAPETRSYGCVGQAANSTSFEISSFKKAPSPIINDAFEGVTHDDDL